MPAAIGVERDDRQPVGQRRVVLDVLDAAPAAACRLIRGMIAVRIETPMIP